VARHDFGVPLEVAADMLHHTRSGDGTAPPATHYYSRLPARDAAFVWHELIHQLMERATTVTLAPIDPAEELAQLLARAATSRRARYSSAGIRSIRSFSATVAEPGYASVLSTASSASGAHS
jgi:hypothetical protein